MRAIEDASLSSVLALSSSALPVLIGCISNFFTFFGVLPTYVPSLGLYPSNALRTPDVPVAAFIFVSA